MKIIPKCVSLIIGALVSVNLYATDYYFCKATTFNTKIPKEQGDTFVAFYGKDALTLIDQIHAVNLIFVKDIQKSHNEYDLYQKKENDFNYTAKIYNSRLKIKLTRYNKLDNINLPETMFKCTQGANIIDTTTVQKIVE